MTVNDLKLEITELEQEAITATPERASQIKLQLRDANEDLADLMSDSEDAELDVLAFEG